MSKITDINRIKEFEYDMRLWALEMAKDAGREGSHIGGSFSSLEIIAVLYGSVMKYDAKNPEWADRDLFIPSKTHCILTHFSALCKAGYVTYDDLFSFHHDGGMFAGHPWNVEIGLDFSGGSLGMGLGVGIGRALYAKRYNSDKKVYVLIGDGESNEGSVWEGLMSAPKFKLDNLIVIFDYNNMQFDGVNDDIMPLTPLADKVKAFGWKTVEVNGHDIEAIYDALQTEHKDQPLAVVAHTVKAHGIPSLENKPESHHAVLSNEDYEYVMEQIREGSL